MTIDKKLKKQVLNKIKEIYPKINKNDLIILVGSRAKGDEIPESDIDILIFTKNKVYFKKQSIIKNLRNNNEDPGFELRLDNGLFLEVKVQEFKVPKFDPIHYHDLMNAVPLTNKRLFKDFQNKIKKEFKKNYERLLFDSYIHFFNEFKNMAGISIRKDPLSKINLEIKKGISKQALLRLILVMNRKPYPVDKFLAHAVSKIKDWHIINDFIINLDKINDFDQYKEIKNHIQSYINNKMPKRDYVNNWWKYLDKFKGF